MLTLPHGLWLDDERHQQVWLRPLTGEDEAFLGEQGASLTVAELTTQLLARCLLRFSTLSLADRRPAALMGALTVGDREALLLHLRRLTIGERLQSELTCPDEACAAQMDLDMTVSSFLLPPYPAAASQYTAAIAENGAQIDVRFRLPTGADQEAVAAVAQQDVPAAERLLLQRCLLAPAGEPPAAVKAALPSLLLSHDPQAELRLEVTCPECGTPFSTLLDTATFFLQELQQRAANLYREVHLLAFYYHWSEAEIMGMTAVKRHRYLDLLQTAMAEAAP